MERTEEEGLRDLGTNGLRGRETEKRKERMWKLGNVEMNGTPKIEELKRENEKLQPRSYALNGFKSNIVWLSDDGVWPK